ncbi:hypothetical protein Nepgr_028860 [Nepenthes gracilis]|uniref:Uncharacterized protein n=1 Tax=Nepenthes gracilis TaxID=150966 RepID=A0AAD3TED9_NEPGR|nr:hypothetical protein Nepgr_028860 [Nepenthes gracilis]
MTISDHLHERHFFLDFFTIYLAPICSPSCPILVGLADCCAFRSLAPSINFCNWHRSGGFVPRFSSRLHSSVADVGLIVDVSCGGCGGGLQGAIRAPLLRPVGWASIAPHHSLCPLLRCYPR